MKRIVLFAVVLAIAASCSIKEMETANVPAPSMYGYTEEDQATKTAITVDGEGVGTIWWKPADNINVFFGTTSVRYYSTNVEDATTVVFETSDMIGSTESASTSKWGLYPFSSSATCDGSAITTTIPAAQQCVPETFGNNLFPMIAHTSSNELHFKNVCGGIKFSLSRDDIQSITFSGNNNEDIVGQVRLSLDGEDNPVATVVAGEKTITLTPSTGTTFASGTNYYLVMLPSVLASGFTMTFETETETGTFEYTAKSIEIKRSIFARKANIDMYATFVAKGSPSTAKDLSADGTANCYIVSEYGSCKFDATKKGHTSESVGAIASAEVLWESFGNDVQPAVGDIVKDVAVKNGIVSFTASGKDGNAVIAVKDASGTILWSWHIWVCQGFDPEATAQVYNNNAGTMMDRNLGATSATPSDVYALGLLYQWGRKDPFLGSSSISSNTKAASTIIWPSAVESDSANGTIAYATAHPTTFISYNSKNYDWYYTGSKSTDNTRWQTSDKTKGLYDPCPAGYRVPDGGSNGVWAKAFGTSSYWETSSNWDSTNRGMDFGKTDKKLGLGNIWYPAAGSLSIYGYAGSLNSVGSIARYWSCTPISNAAYVLYFNDEGIVDPPYDNDRAYGFGVRCLREEATPEPELEAKVLSANGTANCYIVSEYGPCKFDATKKGHSNESVGAIASAEVLWESLGTNVQPEVGDIVSNVSVADGIVSFTASGKDGNAVIAVKDAADDILWSWHIWVCQGFDPAATAQEFYNNAGTVMDRNLGATSAAKGDVKALGLLYQWGRKDPFLGSSSISSSTKAKSTITWPSPVKSNSSNGTIDYATAHPTTFITENSGNLDWYYTGSTSTDNTRWQTSDKTKGLYDPCPVGYRVPDGGSNGVWAKAFGTSSYWETSSNWDSTNRGMDFGKTDKKLGLGNIWYPAAGSLYGYAGSLDNVGHYGRYWSCTPRSNTAYLLNFSDDGYVNPSDGNDRARGLGVRCVKQ